MEAIGLIASIATIVEFTPKIVSLISQARDGKGRIQQLKDELKLLQAAADELRCYVEVNKYELELSRDLMENGKACEEFIRELKQELEKYSSPDPRTMNWVERRLLPLKWPAKSKDIDAKLTRIGRWHKLFRSALEIDTSGLICRINETLYRNRLGEIPTATYQSNTVEYCLSDTRTEILADIEAWTQCANGPTIFWLCGMAGVGKSTISKTVCRNLYDKNMLGASFFFNKDEAARTNPLSFIPFLVAQLIDQLPELKPHVWDALEKPKVETYYNLEDQFNKLFLGPLSKIDAAIGPKRLIVIVLDALDECDGGTEYQPIKSIIGLLSKLDQAISSLHIRIFVTSRPEIPIEIEFHHMPRDTYSKILLHNIPTETIQHDIELYFSTKLRSIQKDHSQILPVEWPGQKTVKNLAKLASPLFIFAATVCLHLRTKGHRPQELIVKVLEGSFQGGNPMGLLYASILNQILDDCLDRDTQAILTSDLKLLLGSIVTMVDPLSIASIARLLGLDPELIYTRLSPLKSILMIPGNMHEPAPIRALHLSFPEFLVNQHYAESNRLWCDQTSAHATLAERCLTFLMKDGILKKDMCGLKDVATAPANIDPTLIQNKFRPDLVYACKYWALHLLASTGCNTWTSLQQLVLSFLQTRVLYWIESMSILGKLTDAVLQLKGLQRLPWVQPVSVEIQTLLKDAHRLLFDFRTPIEEYPLQAYISPLLLSPQDNTIRQWFESDIPPWILTSPKIKDSLHARYRVVPTLISAETNSDIIFSRNGRFVAGISSGYINVFDTASNVVLRLGGKHCTVQFGPVGCFSFDGTMIGTNNLDSVIKVWDTKQPRLQCLRTIEASDRITCLAFTSQGTLVSGHNSSTPTMDIRHYWGDHPRATHSLRVWSHDGTLLRSCHLPIIPFRMHTYSSGAFLLVQGYTEDERLTGISFINHETGQCIWSRSDLPLHLEFPALKTPTAPILCTTEDGHILELGTTDGKTMAENEITLSDLDVDCCKPKTPTLYNNIVSLHRRITNRIYIFSLLGGGKADLLQTFIAPQSMISPLVVSPACNYMAGFNIWKGVIYLFTIGDPLCMATKQDNIYNGYCREHITISLNPARCFAALTYRKPAAPDLLYLWNMFSLERDEIATTDSPIMSSVFSPDGRYLAVITLTRFQLFDTTRKSSISLGDNPDYAYKPNPDYYCMRTEFSPNSKYVVLSCSTYGIQWWDITSRTLIHPASRCNMLFFAFSADSASFFVFKKSREDHTHISRIAHVDHFTASSGHLLGQFQILEADADSTEEAGKDADLKASSSSPGFSLLQDTRIFLPQSYAQLGPRTILMKRLNPKISIKDILDVVNSSKAFQPLSVLFRMLDRDHQEPKDRDRMHPPQGSTGWVIHRGLKLVWFPVQLRQYIQVSNDWVFGFPQSPPGELITLQLELNDEKWI